MPKVLVSDPIAKEGIEILQKSFDVDVKTGLEKSELIKIIGEYDALAVRSETKVTADVLEAAKKLKIIGRAGVGVDNIDVPLATQKGIIVVNSPAGNTIAAAELTMAMMLSMSRNIPKGHEMLRAGEWKAARKALIGVEQNVLLAAVSAYMDVHRATASEVFGVPPGEVSSEQRRYAKTINFGLIYGMSAFGLAAQLGIEREAAKNWIERYFARYPGVKRYMDDSRAQAKSQGWVETVFGRRLWLPEINSPNGPRRGAAERQAINAPLQGTAVPLSLPST